MVDVVAEHSLFRRSINVSALDKQKELCSFQTLYMSVPYLAKVHVDIVLPVGHWWIALIIGWEFDDPSKLIRVNYL